MFNNVLSEKAPAVKKKRPKKCLRGEFIYNDTEHCLQRMGPMRHPLPCRDLTHLQGCGEYINCTNFQEFVRIVRLCLRDL